jgi:hypothetical protein
MDPTTLWIAASVIAIFAGFVKGATGFALPMIMISGLSTIMEPERALALLILPTVLSNLWQALRGGLEGARRGLRTHWRYVLVVAVCILFGGHLVRILPTTAIYLLIGVPILLFSLAQLAGWQLRLEEARRRTAEIVIAAVAGLIGGVSGVWGPPTVLYLNALDTPKGEHVQVQGLVYGIGSVMLLATHLRSGILNDETLPQSAAMVVPVVLGLVAGMAVHDRMDARRFRQVMQVALILAALNLIRRGLMG